MNTLRRHRWIKNQVLIGIGASIALTGFYLVSQRTNWLAPSPLVCGGWQGQRFVKASSVEALKAEGATPRFCVREVLRPYSKSMADVWAGVSIFRPQGELYIENEFFVARDFGKDRFSDEPGDWMVQRSTSYDLNGIQQNSRIHQVASWYDVHDGKKASHDHEQETWYDPMLDRATALELWKLIQLDVSASYPERRISWVRQFNESAPELAFSGFLIFFCYGVYKRLYGSPFGGRELHQPLNKRAVQRGLIKELGLLLLLLAGWSALRWTDWLSHTPFACTTYRSSQPGASNPIEVCFHEVLSLPGIDNQTTVLGASIHTPNQVIRSDMQFYIANGQNKLKFKDEPGDWAFLGLKRYDPRTHLLASSSDATISSWYDAAVPADVQLQIWTDVRDKLAPQLKAHRVSIPRKLSAVLDSFAALAAASVIAIMTFIKLVEVTVIDVDRS